MSEACVQEIELPKPKLISFIKEVQRKHGSILSLSELFARDEKLGSEVILGVVDNVYPVVRRHDRQLQVIRLLEVTIKCTKGLLFSVYAFNKFALSLADICLQKGDFVALFSPSVRNSSRYRIEDGCHQLEAHIGMPLEPNAKIFFARNPHIANAGTSKQHDSSTNCKSLRVSVKRRATSSTVSSTSTPIFTGTSLNSAAMSQVPVLSSTARMSPAPPILGNAARMSPAPPILGNAARMSPAPSILGNAARMSPAPPILGNAARMSPAPSILGNAARMSPVSPILSHTSQFIVPCTSTSRDRQIQRQLGDSAVALRGTRNKYTYTKLSELSEPDNRVNIYGVIHAILKLAREDSKHAIVRLKDETCEPGMSFRVHIFFTHETAFPKVEHGYILRLHRLKTELFDGVLDGRVFRATDVVTFPPDGQGMENVFTTSKHFNFTDSDAQRLTELRRWIASQNQQQPLPLPDEPFTSNASLRAPGLSSGPNRTLLCDIKEAGKYVLFCKVLDVHLLSNEMRYLTVTDGTLFVYCLDPDEDERHATRAVRILVLNPSAALKKVKRSAFVQLTNVTVDVAVGYESSPCIWPFLCFQLNGDNCAVKIFKGFEPEAVELKSRLRAARLRDPLQPADPVDQLMTGQPSGRPRQPNCGNCVLDTDIASRPAVQTGCPQSEMATHLPNYNSSAVQQYVASGGKTSVQFEDQQCVPSSVSCAEQLLNCEPLQKSSLERGGSNVQQLHVSQQQRVLTGSRRQKGDSRDEALLSRDYMQQDYVLGVVVSESFLQQMNDEFNETCNEFDDGIATGSDAGNRTDIQFVTSQTTNAVRVSECAGDVEMNEVESLASEILPPSEVDVVDSSDRFSALTSVNLRGSGTAQYQEAETLAFSDDSSDSLTVISDGRDCTSRSFGAECERCFVDQDLGSSYSAVVECTDENEDTECCSADGCKWMIVSGLTTGVQGIPKDILGIKRSRLQTGKQEVYLLRAWVKDIEPPINRGSEMDIVSGICCICNSVQNYGALRLSLKKDPLCQCCFQKGQENPVVLEYLMRLHLIDSNDDELIVTVMADYGVELLGCTVNAYLYDSVAKRRVLNMLTDLMADGSNELLVDRGILLKLLVSPIRTSMGKEYIVHSTYLYIKLSH